jgi:hypothetical protein
MLRLPTAKSDKMSIRQDSAGIANNPHAIDFPK